MDSTPSASSRSMATLALVGVERRDHRAGMAHSLAHLEPPAAGHERRGPLEVQIVEAREPQAPDLQEVAKAGRREQPGAGAAALEDGIGGHGRAVDDLRHRARLESRLGEQRGGALDDRLGVVRRAREHLAGERASVRRRQDQVGEGAAHVHAEPIAAAHWSWPPTLPPSASGCAMAPAYAVEALHAFALTVRNGRQHGASDRGVGWGRGPSPRDRCFCALPKSTTSISWSPARAVTGCESACPREGPSPARRFVGTSP